LKNVKNEIIAKKIFNNYSELIKLNVDSSEKDNESEKIISELIKVKDIISFFKSNTYADSINNISQFTEFSPYLNKYTSQNNYNQFYSLANYQVDLVGKGFVTLYTRYGVSSSNAYRMYFVKNNYLIDVDFTNFDNEMNKFISKKHPCQNCFSEIKYYEWNKSKNEMIISGGIYYDKDGLCCPSYQFKAIARSNKNKLIVKTISSTKSLN
jgi:hypothetical protein